jgi:hypothetical protein
MSSVVVFPTFISSAGARWHNVRCRNCLRTTASRKDTSFILQFDQIHQAKIKPTRRLRCLQAARQPPTSVVLRLAHLAQESTGLCKRRPALAIAILQPSTTTTPLRFICRTSPLECNSDTNAVSLVAIAFDTVWQYSSAILSID